MYPQQHLFGLINRHRFSLKLIGGMVPLLLVYVYEDSRVCVPHSHPAELIVSSCPYGGGLHSRIHDGGMRNLAQSVLGFSTGSQV